MEREKQRIEALENERAAQYEILCAFERERMDLRFQIEKGRLAAMENTLISRKEIQNERQQLLQQRLLYERESLERDRGDVETRKRLQGNQGQLTNTKANLSTRSLSRRSAEVAELTIVDNQGSTVPISSSTSSN